MPEKDESKQIELEILEMKKKVIPKKKFDFVKLPIPLS